MGERITYANVMSTIAVFCVLGGGAYAASELEKNEVKSKHIKAGAVKNADLADNAVTAPQVANGSLRSEDFAAGQLPQGQPGPQGEQGPPGSPDTPQGVLDKIKQVDGAGSGLDAETVAGIAASELGTYARSSALGGCTDDNHTVGGANCTTLSATLPRSGRVLLVGSGTMSNSTNDDEIGPGSTTDITGLVVGSCSLFADNSQQGNSTYTTMFHDTEQASMSLQALTEPLSAGEHIFRIKCSEIDGDIDFDYQGLTAVMLGAA